MPRVPAPPDRARALAWTAVASWSAVILLLSTDSFSAGQTSRIVGPLLDLLFPGLDPALKAVVHGAVRKLAHFVEYAVLGGLAHRALALRPGRSALRAAGLGLLLAAAVALADETGQSLRADRTGSSRDVALDVAGAGFGLALCLGAAAARRPRAAA